MYTTKIIENIKNSSGSWDSQRIGVFYKDVQTGEYVRNYHWLYNTFFPFEQDGKWYALYSKDYTATRVMTLPDCKDFCGEERDEFGFCPVDYYIPRYKEWTLKGYTEEELVKRKVPKENWERAMKNSIEKIYDHEIDESFEEVKDKPFIYEKFGFVSGCVWGDDTSWKIQFLDLSELSKSILKRDDRFGYIEQPHNLSLKESVRIYDGFLLTFNIQKHYHIDRNGQVTKEF